MTTDQKKEQLEDTSNMISNILMPHLSDYLDKWYPNLSKEDILTKHEPFIKGAIKNILLHYGFIWDCEYLQGTKTISELFVGWGFTTDHQ